MNKKVVVSNSIDYMLKNFANNITLDDISRNVCLSKYYFSRIFKEETGESVYAFLKRLKMEQSAMDIKFQKGRSLSEIGLDYGYSSTNFSSAFKESYGVSPRTYKNLVDPVKVNNPFYPKQTEYLPSYEDYQQHVHIKVLPAWHVVYERMVGNYSDIKNEWGHFVSKHRRHFNQHTLLLEKFYSDPASTTYHNNICDLCFTVDNATTMKNGMMIEKGKFAVYSFEGPIQDIFNQLQGFYLVWLKQSIYTMREKYGLNIYRKIDWENDYVQMDVCIPIR